MTNMNYQKIKAGMKLRKLELEAYSSLINAFRAQGNFCKEKKRILLELRSYLSITIERHQAEIRRAVNDEKLSKISSHLNGEDKLDAWIIEGRRVIPLLKRMAPKTGVSSVADRAARFQCKQNQQIEIESSINDHSFESNTNQSAVDEINRKRQYAGELVNSKRKYQASSIDKQKLKLTTKVSVAALNVSNTKNENPVTSNQTNNNNLIANDKQKHKLLIMSTKPTPLITNKSVDHSSQTAPNQSSSVKPNNRIESVDQSTEASGRIDLDDIKTSTDLNSSINQLITTSSAAKIFNPKVQNTLSHSPKLMILPNSSGQQTKTLTIPILHTVKLPAQNSAILYSAQQPMVSSSSLTNCSTNALKTVPGITIQAIKTQSGNKSNNFIIMPNKTQSVNTIGTTQAKGLLRQMSVTNAKEFPLKFISTNTQTVNSTKDQQNDKTYDPTEQQPTIILTNMNKERTSSPIRNLIKNQSSHPNIIKGIKVIPKCSTPIQNQIQTACASTGKTGTKTSPNQKAITIPANFMEILKNIPINRISSPQSPSNDSTKTTISITQNSNLNAQQLTKANLVKIPANATTESITKLIFSSVSNSSPINSTTVGVHQIGVGQTQTVNSLSKTVSSNLLESKKITLITKNTESSDLKKPSPIKKQSIEDNVIVKQDIDIKVQDESEPTSTNLSTTKEDAINQDDTVFDVHSS